MKISVVLLIVCGMLCGCASVTRYNSHLNDVRSVESLRSDVDYVHRKLERLHPSLYRYISKEELDRKFDSLKLAITSPMTGRDFFFHLSPVVASVRQGHTRLFPPTRRLTKKEEEKVRRYGTSPLAHLHLGWFDRHLFLTQKVATDSILKPGTEILSMDSITPQQLFAKYEPTFASDGFNLTFHDRVFNKKFASYFYFEKGMRDSVACKVNYKGDERLVWLKQPELYSKKNLEKPLRTTETEKLKRSGLEKMKKIQGYDALSKTFSKNFRYENPDSSVVVFTIRDFVKGKYKRFYADSFSKIDSQKTKALIIDLRDNTGGNLSDIQCLYSYLTETDFHFVKPALVTSKTSLWHDDYFKVQSPAQFLLRILGTPGWMLYNSLTSLITHKKDDHYYFYYPPIWKKHPQINRFRGKVYVLINGCSFSASSIISANLKGSGRAVFVGEETGGAYNGCVAGEMPSFTLPGSKLKLSFGLLEVATPYSCSPDGRGIMPDVRIVPTLNDKLKGIDPELRWVLDDVCGKHVKSK
jgi:hypothetical protein